MKNNCSTNTFAPVTIHTTPPLKQVNNIITQEVAHEFAEKEVLENPYHRELRKDTLYLAMVLGNNYGKKVQMQTVTASGNVELHGVVLAMNESFVFLKGGTKIPVHAISEVKVY